MRGKKVKVWLIYGLRFACCGHRYDGRIRYIGQTRRAWPTRWRQHELAVRAGRTPLCKVMRKYGAEAFSLVVLAICETREAANTTERGLIAAHATLISAKRGGLNVERGGEGRDFSDPVSLAKHKRALANPRFLAANRERMATQNRDPTFIAKQRAALARLHRDEAMQARRIENVLASSAWKAAQVASSERTRKRNADPEFKAVSGSRMTTFNKSDRGREQSRAQAAKLNADPKSRIKMAITRNRQSVALWQSRGDGAKAAEALARIAALEAQL